MWYRADLLFAQLPKEGKQSVKCETCNVLFKASSAVEAYDKAIRWATSHVEEDSLFQFLGVEHISDIGEEQPGDGTEIAGAFYDDENVWERKDELIPEKSQIPAIMLEQNKDVPVGELMTEKQKRDIKEIFGED
jgi:hypothetical protein